MVPGEQSHFQVGSCIHNITPYLHSTALGQCWKVPEKIHFSPQSTHTCIAELDKG